MGVFLRAQAGVSALRCACERCVCERGALRRVPWEKARTWAVNGSESGPRGLGAAGAACAQGPGPGPRARPRLHLAGSRPARGRRRGWGPRQRPGPRRGWLGNSSPGRGRGLGRGRAGGGVWPGAGRAGAGGAVPRTRQAGERAAAGGRRASERGSGAGRAMGRRAAGALLLALLLHGRLLAVSVRGGGPGAPGAPLAAPANLAGAPRLRGCDSGPGRRRRQGPRAGTGRRHPPPWGCPEGRPGPCVGPGAWPARVGARGSPGHVAESPGRGRHGPACHSWGPGGETSSRVGTWQGEGTPFCAILEKVHSGVMRTLSILTGTFPCCLSPRGACSRAGTSKELF